MKFTFKIQKYQTQAVDALVKCFEGQQFADEFFDNLREAF